MLVHKFCKEVARAGMQLTVRC